MMSRPYINLALDSLMKEPWAHIMLQHPVTNEVVPPEVEATRRAGQEFFKNCIFPNKKVDCNKPKAGVYAKWRDIDVDANRIYGLPSQECLFNLLDYGQLNGGYIPRLTQMRGGCLLNAVHKSIKCPREFTNTHLRCMLVLFMVENCEMLWILLHICILNNFGHHRLSEEEFQAKVADGTITDAEREAYSEPGPFFVYSCLQSLLKPSFYGDELCLLIITMIWKVRITVLHAETLLAIKFRHMNVSMKTGIILVHCSGSHYIPLGISLPVTSFLFFYFFNQSYVINSSCLHSNCLYYTSIFLFIQHYLQNYFYLYNNQHMYINYFALQCISIGVYVMLT